MRLNSQNITRKVYARQQPVCGFQFIVCQSLIDRGVWQPPPIMQILPVGKRIGPPSRPPSIRLQIQAGTNATKGAGHETAGNIRHVLFELGVEPSLTVLEAAAILRWSYWKARRYFSQVDGICVSYQPKRYKRPYRTFTIPVSVFAREWQKMTGHEPEAAHVLHDRLALAIQK